MSNIIFSEETIKELLRLCPSNTKEVRDLQVLMENVSLEEIYNKILQTRLTNKEMLYFLTIMNRFPRNINCDFLIAMKAQNYDKYVGSTLISYFSLCIKYFYDTGEFTTTLSSKHKIDLFLKFIYVFEEDIIRNIEIYNLFKVFLREDFFEAFLFNKCYLKFGFLREFITDFYGKLGSRIVQIGYEKEEYRRLIYTLRPDPWILQWSRSPSLSKLFYYFDLVPCRENIIFSKIINLDNFQNELYRELQEGIEDESTINEYEQYILSQIEMKDIFRKHVDMINNGQFPDKIDLCNIYCCNSISLKSLGDILSKEKHSKLLRKWAELIDYRKLNILEALRIFLNTFQLPSESQIIERVIWIFTEEYISQNQILQDPILKDKLIAKDKYKSKTEKELDKIIITDYFKTIYSFIFLNTMLYKVNNEKHMGFRDYYTKIETDIFTMDEIQKFYDDIVSSELKFPLHWTDGYDKYLVSLKIYKTLFNKNGKQLNINSKSAIIACYKHIFIKNQRCFQNMDVISFFNLCIKFNTLDLFDEFLDELHDPLRILQGYTCIIPQKCLSNNQANQLLQTLEKITKPKIQEMFKFLVKSKVTIFPQYADIYNKLCTIQCNDAHVFNHNIELFLTFNLHESATIFVNNFIETNLLLIANIQFLNSSLKFKYILSNTDQYNALDADQKLQFMEYLVDNNHINTFKLLYEQFVSLIMQSPNNNRLFALFIKSIDYIDNPFQTAIDTLENEGGIILYDEHFRDGFKKTTNIIKLMQQDMSIVNKSWIVKLLNNNICPAETIEITNYYKLTYLFGKTKMITDTRLIKYINSLLDLISTNTMIYTRQIKFLLNHDIIINETNVNINIKEIIALYFNKIKNNRLICCKLCVNNRTKAELYYKELYTFGEELYFQGLIDKKNLDQFKLIVADSNDSNQLVIL